MILKLYDSPYIDASIAELYLLLMIRPISVQLNQRFVIMSIDGHKLTVVGTDGYWLEPIKEVDYVIIHSGERYDFLLDATQTSLENYWIRAETLEIDTSQGGPPFQSLGNAVEAILHYKQGIDDQEILSTEYEAIMELSPSRQCTEADPCIAVNCPFQNFLSSYYIECVNVNEMRLLEPAPRHEMPNADPDPNCADCSHLLNLTLMVNHSQLL